MRVLLASALVFAALFQSQEARTFTGTITDSECANANHALMRMGDTDPECVKACLDFHAATFVLYDGSVTYALSDQTAPAPFAGRKVTVTGTLDEKTRRITVRSITAAN